MKQKKTSSGILAGKGFYIALSLCVAMIGAACYFAYRQTSGNLSGQLESIDPLAELEVDVTETGIPKQTTLAVHAPARTSTTEATTTVTTTTVSTAAPETKPAVTVPAAILDKPEDAPAPVMPVPGEITQPFSGKELVKSKTTGAWQTHNGVDFAANPGDAVKAIAKGVVTSVGEDGLWGICVEIDHGSGIVSKYCGLNTGIVVTVGQELTGGTVIGAVGDTAEMELAEDPHLHLELKQNGSFIDPEAWIKGQS